MFGEAPEVLTVGAGPVGLFAAYDLARRGIRVQVVDTGVWPCAHSYALALHPQSLRLMRETGLLNRIMDHCSIVRTMAFYQRSERKATVRLDADGAPGMAVLRQDLLEKALEQALDDRDVRVSWRHEVSRLEPRENEVAVTIDKFEQESRGYVVAHNEWVVAKSTEIVTPYVIGADGYVSRVRRALGFDFPEVGPATYYAVFELEGDAGVDDEMRVVFSDGAISVLWPLPGGGCRWSFQLNNYTDHDQEDLKNRLRESGFGDFPTRRVKDRLMTTGAAEFPMLEEDFLRQLISERAPWFQARIEGLGWRTVVRFERRLATGFGKGRLWLAGDAAHLTGPVGVQSMNLGLFEAHDLATILARVVRGESGPEPLEDYDHKWTATWRQLAGLEGKLRAKPGADSWVAAHADRILGCLPAHGPELAALAGQLGLEFESAKGSMA